MFTTGMGPRREDFLVPRPKFRRPRPAASPILRVIVAHRRDARWTLLEYKVVEHHLLHPLQ